MTNYLPRLRSALDVFPSPVEDQPGLLIRDPFRYTEDILIIPPVFISALQMLDGRHTETEVQNRLTQVIGRPFPIHPLHEFVEVLRMSGFLETEEFNAMRAQKHAEFAAEPFRLPSHAGAAYPDSQVELRSRLNNYLMTIVPPNPAPILGIAAPHVSPEGGWQCYAAAYNRLRGLKDKLQGKTIVILGTSHYGEPEKFGLTRKSFQTPYGTIETNMELVDWLMKRAGDAINIEDYCHSVEHSIELQVVFLQHMLGNDFKILPVLCGAFVESFMSGKLPETGDGVRNFFEALGEMQEQQGDNLFWVLGIDLAHIGQRYGDPLEARAEQGYLQEVREKDYERMQQVCAGNSGEFFELVVRDYDPLKWCGFTPVYTFMQAVKGAHGEVLKYDQWNIDESSVVSFTAMEFAGK
ncbi:MAG: AmmeMemoRadiSam system protein B [Acidobacteria bacterium]|nr:AmmeMemoRadiSam system protein B [Acidobacteriota bacterium]